MSSPRFGRSGADDAVAPAPAVRAGQPARPGLALGATLVVQTLASLVLAAPAVLAPAVAPGLGYAADRVGLLVGLMYFMAMLSGLWGGQGVARLGAVRLSQHAMLACALGAFAMLGGHGAWLLAGAALVGAGYGVINPASTALLGRHSPAARRALFFSVKQTGVPLGVALAGVLLPAALLLSGWQSPIAAAAAACVIVAFALQSAVARLDRNDARADTGHRRPAAHGLGALASVLRDPVLRGMSLMSLTFACMQLAFVTFLVSLLNLRLGHSLAWAAGTLAVAQVVATGARIVLGHIADRWIDAGRLLGLLGLAMGASGLALALLEPGTPAGWVVAAAVFGGATAMGWNGVFLAELARTAAARRADVATAAGASQFFTFSGSVLGPVVFAEIVRVSDSYALGYALLAIPATVAGVWALRAGVRGDAAVSSRG